MPVVSGNRACLFSFDQPRLVWVGYPVPGLGRVWDPEPSPPRGDPLAVALGEPRAGIVRLAQTPSTMSELATLLSRSPATITHHCRQLVAADLVRREQRGRQAWISLTDKGADLLDLLT